MHICKVIVKKISVTFFYVDPMYIYNGRPTVTMYDLSNGTIFSDLEWQTNGHNIGAYLNVTPLFDAEYLRNGKRYRHSFNVILIGTYTSHTQG